MGSSKQISKFKPAFWMLLIYTLIGTPIILLALGLTQEGSKKSSTEEIIVQISAFAVIIYTILQWVLLHIFNKHNNNIGLKVITFFPLLLLIAYIIFVNTS